MAGLQCFSAISQSHSIHYLYPGYFNASIRQSVRRLRGFWIHVLYVNPRVWKTENKIGQVQFSVNQMWFCIGGQTMLMSRSIITSIALIAFILAKTKQEQYKRAASAPFWSEQRNTLKSTLKRRYATKIQRISVHVTWQHGVNLMYKWNAITYAVLQLDISTFSLYRCINRANWEN